MESKNLSLRSMHWSVKLMVNNDGKKKKGTWDASYILICLSKSQKRRGIWNFITIANLWKHLLKNTNIENMQLVDHLLEYTFRAPILKMCNWWIICWSILFEHQYLKYASFCKPRNKMKVLSNDFTIQSSL